MGALHQRAGPDDGGTWAPAISWWPGDQAHVHGVVIGARPGAVVFLAGADVTRPDTRWRTGRRRLGAGSMVGLLALYRALAMGRMGIAAPVSGVLSAAVPVVAGAVLEGRPGAVRLIGFALALMAVWLVSRSDDGAFCAGDLGLPVAAGLGFGLFIVIIGRASAGVCSGRWWRHAPRRGAR
jgi:drug/metabolite transporter (DMT)-like permease